MEDIIGSVDEIMRGSGPATSSSSENRASYESSTDTPGISLDSPPEGSSAINGQNTVVLSEEAVEERQEDKSPGNLSALLQGLQTPVPSAPSQSSGGMNPLGAMTRELDSYISGTGKEQNARGGTSQNEEHHPSPAKKSLNGGDSPRSSQNHQAKGSDPMVQRLLQKKAMAQLEQMGAQQVAFTPHINNGEEIKEGRTIGKIDGDLSSLDKGMSAMGMNTKGLADASDAVMKTARESVEKSVGKPVDMTGNGSIIAKSPMKAQSIDAMTFSVSPVSAASPGSGSSSASGIGDGGGEAAPSFDASSIQASSSSNVSSASPSSDSAGGSGTEEGADKSGERSTSNPPVESGTQQSPGEAKSPQNITTKQKEKVISELTRDPEKILRNGGLSGEEVADTEGQKNDDVSSSSSASPDGKKEDKSPLRSAFMPFDARVLFNPESSMKEGDIVKTGQKIAKVDVDVKGLEEFSFKEAVMGLLTKCVGDSADLQKDGSVTAQSTRKIESLARGEELSEQKNLLKEKDLDVSNPYEVFMEQQGTQDYQKTTEYLDKNGEANDSSWVKERLATIENRDAAEQRGVPQGNDLLSQYKSLWKSDYLDKSPRPGEQHVFSTNL
jgi:hypothetical protein